VFEALLGNQTAPTVASTSPEEALTSKVDGTEVVIPEGVGDPLTVDLAAGAASLDIEIADREAGGFKPTAGGVAASAGDSYTSIAQPLAGGDFRLAVVLQDRSAPSTYTYDLGLEPGVRSVRRPDGGYDFVDADGGAVGGVAAPWGLDAAGHSVDVTYDLQDGRLVRTVLTDRSTVFPVVTNFCIFGKNPNGSCRGSGSVSSVWRFVTGPLASALKRCGAGAAVTVTGRAAAQVATNVALRLAGEGLVAISGGGYAYVGFAVGGCITNLLR
jgi:hypothetical protein